MKSNHPCLWSKRKAVTLTAGLVALWLATSPASAALINVDSTSTIGSTSNLGWSLQVNDVTLTAQAVYTLTSFANDRVDFSVSLTNTTVADDNASVSSFGFNTDPALTGASLNPVGTYFNSLAVNPSPNIPGGFTVDLCVWTSSNCASGTFPQALPKGETDTFGLSLFGNFSSGLALSSFPLRFVGDYGSHVFPPENGNGVPVPEPKSLLLLSVGLLVAVGVLRRRERLVRRRA